MVFLWNIEWMKNEFFIVVYTWKHRAATVLYYHQKIPSQTPPHKVTKKEKWIFYSSKHISSHLWLLMLGKFETKARILAMRLAFARLLASFTTISKNPFFALYKKKRTSFAWPSNYFSRNYFLVSLKTTCLRNFGEYFFNSKRSGLLRLFLLVKYKRSPVSAHSNKMLIRMNDTSHFQIDSITHRFFYDLPVYNNKILDICQRLLLQIRYIFFKKTPISQICEFLFRNKQFYYSANFSLILST